MDYKKNIRLRLVLFGIYFIAGIALFGFGLYTDRDFWVSLGCAFAAVGGIKALQFFRLLKNEEALKQQETAEKDERNIYIMQKARNLAAVIYIICSFIALVLLQLAGLKAEGRIVAYSICCFLIINLICYYAVRMKN